MKTIKVSRRELYDQVWLTPMRTLAIRYGMSDVGLAKVCRRHEIPRPHVGYWAKKEVGKAPPQVALSPSRNPSLDEITLWDGPIEHPQPEPPVEYDTDIQALLDNAVALSPVKVPTSMHNLHPLVRDAKEELEKSHVDFVGMVSSFRRDRGLVEVRVAKGSVRRAILFLDTLFKTIEKLGGKITLEFTDRWNPETTTLVNLSGTTVRGLRLREKYKQIKRIKDPKDPWSYPSTDKVPTGHFVLDQGTCYGQQYCEDGKKPGTEIELRINAIVISLIHEAGQSRIAERKADAERQIAEEKERIRLQRAAERKQKRDEFRQLQKTEQAKLDRLMSETSRWHKSQRIRGYLAAIEQSVAVKGCPNPE